MMEQVKSYRQTSESTSQESIEIICVCVDACVNMYEEADRLAAD